MAAHLAPASDLSIWQQILYFQIFDISNIKYLLVHLPTLRMCECLDFDPSIQRMKLSKICFKVKVMIYISYFTWLHLFSQNPWSANVLTAEPVCIIEDSLVPNSSSPLQHQMAYTELHFGNHVSALRRRVCVSTLCALPSVSKHRHWCGKLWNKSNFLQPAWKRGTKRKACFVSCVSIPSFCSWTGAFPRSFMWSSLWVSVTLHKMVPSYCLQAQRRRTRFGPHSSRRWSPRSVTHIFTHFLLYTWKTNHCYYWCRYFWIIWWTRATQEWQLLQTVIEEFGKEQILLQHDRGHYSLVEAEARNLTQNANMDTPGYTKFYFQKRVVKWSHAVQRWVRLIWMAVIWKLENKGTQRQVG